MASKTGQNGNDFPIDRGFKGYAARVGKNKGVTKANGSGSDAPSGSVLGEGKTVRMPGAQQKLPKRIDPGVKGR